MTVCERLWNGRHLDNKMLSKPALVTDEWAMFADDARRGSKMLRDAIFRANGYIIPEVTPPAPVFEPVKIQIRRNRGGQKRSFIPNPKVARIIDLAAERAKTTPEELIGRSRKKEITAPRHIAMYLARKLEGVSYPNIGRQFGGRDHTTILSAIRDVERLIAYKDSDTILALRALQKKLAA